MQKLFLVAMLCLTFSIPAKADFWKKMKNAVLGPGSSTSKSNTSGKTVYMKKRETPHTCIEIYREVQLK